MDPTQLVLSFTGQGPYAGTNEEPPSIPQEENGEQGYTHFAV